MKKLFAVVLSLVLALAAVSFAETAATAEVKEIKWEDYIPLSEEIGGQMAAIEDLGIQMFIPSILSDTEITEENAAFGNFLMLQNETGDMGVVGMKLDGDLNTVVQAYLDDGATGLTQMSINGIPVVNFNREVDGRLTTNLAMPASNSAGEPSVVLFTFAPAGEETADLFRVMVASLQQVQ